MKKRYGILMLVVVFLLTAGCGSRDTAKTESAVAQDTDAGNGWYGESAPAEVTEEMAEAGAAETEDTESLEVSGQKLIKTVNMFMETREFDTLLQSIETKVSESGGYVESSDVSGNSYSNAGGNRDAYLVLRIPSDKLEGFVSEIGSLGNVLSKNESVQDVTLQYVDVESHKKALETEQERLLVLMEQAESVEDIISIESRLSSIRYELQSYESRLRMYDNQVDYSTVSVSVSEVERETAAKEQSFWGAIGTKLSDNFYDIGQGFRNFAIWLISSLPYFVIIGAAAFAGVRLLQKLIWKKPFFRRNRKKDEGEEKDLQK